MMFTYRPPIRLIQLLHDFFNEAPTSCIPSNFPALASRLADLQAEDKDEEYTSYDRRSKRQVQANHKLPSSGTTSSTSMEAPQEKDLDLRLARRRIERAILAMPTHLRYILADCYELPPPGDPLEPALTSRLVGLAKYSKLQPSEHITDPKYMTAVRIELDELWCQAHNAFERNFDQGGMR